MNKTFNEKLDEILDDFGHSVINKDDTRIRLKRLYKQSIIDLIREDVIGTPDEKSEGLPNYDGKHFTKGNMIEHINEKIRNDFKKQQINIVRGSK